MIDPAAGVVKVTDFGIARIADACRTRTGLVLGTPSFMSPEQMSGRRVDGRTDLYSLGVMLFQLLTGALPHRSESMAELMKQIVNDPAPDVRSLRPELPESLANVVALALEKRVEVRYADGDQMAADLRTVAPSVATSPDATAHAPDVTDARESASFEATSEFRRMPSPDGFYYAVVEYPSYLSYLPSAPGSSSDKPGFVTIYSNDGVSCGRAPIPTLQASDDLQWQPDSAEIRLIARWDLPKRSVTIDQE